MRYLFLIPSLALIGCATEPHTYQPPDSSRLKASTTKVSVAVDKAHASAKKAQATVKSATDKAKQVQEETKKIKDLPSDFVQHLADLEGELEQAQKEQAELDTHLKEADEAKKQVETDKQAYFNAAQKLADQATAENGKAVKAEQSLHWYRVHWILTWGLFGLGIILSVVMIAAKFAGKFPFP